jgi:hypothetical protein
MYVCIFVYVFIYLCVCICMYVYSNPYPYPIPYTEEHYDVVWKCYRGQSFGETALESAGGLRTAGAR